MTAPKKQAEETTKPKHSFWQPPEKRGVMSDEGKKWLEENAEAIRSMNDWVDKHGLPLEKYRLF
jgi:uncharacterized protein (DUF2342 family)